MIRNFTCWIILLSLAFAVIVYFFAPDLLP